MFQRLDVIERSPVVAETPRRATIGWHYQPKFSHVGIMSSANDATVGGQPGDHQG